MTTDDTRMRAAWDAELKTRWPDGCADLATAHLFFKKGYSAHAAESSSGAARADGLSDEQIDVLIATHLDPVATYPRLQRFARAILASTSSREAEPAAMAAYRAVGLFAEPSAAVRAGPAWRVAEHWSSGSPGTKVKMIAEGPKEIARHAAHPDFIRWVAAAPTPPSAEPAASLSVVNQQMTTAASGAEQAALVALENLLDAFHEGNAGCVYMGAAGYVASLVEAGEVVLTADKRARAQERGG